VSRNVTKQPRPETLRAIANYHGQFGSRGFSAKEIEQLKKLVREAVKPIAYLQVTSVYRYLRAMSGLSQWALEMGYEPKVANVLSEDKVWAFLDHPTKGQLDYSAPLWRLAECHGLVSPAAAKAARTPQPDYRKPYSADEMASLVEFADSLSNQYRRDTLLTLVALGAGCGITRSRIRGVTASDVHFHSKSMFVNANYCAKVRANFVTLIKEAGARHPTGTLVRCNTNVTERAADWTKGRRGVPVFSTDRLRATYIVALLDEGASLSDLMAWTGLKGTEALEPYLPFMKAKPSHCQLRTEAQ
jgi:integrase